VFCNSLIPKDFRETLGRAKPKTINDLMSLANKWADREDSIQTPDTIVIHQTKEMTRKISITQEHVDCATEASEIATPTLTQPTW
jgi:hypothetical protein